MAEIPIERKSGSKSWLWIVALVLLALVAWMLFSGDDADDGAVTTPAGEVGALPAPAGTPASVAGVAMDGTLGAVRAA